MNNKHSVKLLFSSVIIFAFLFSFLLSVQQVDAAGCCLSTCTMVSQDSLCSGTYVENQVCSSQNECKVQCWVCTANGQNSCSYGLMSAFSPYCVSVGGVLSSTPATSESDCSTKCSSAIPTPGSVSGKVYDSSTNTGLDNVRVSIGSKSTYTNSQGLYSLAGILPGPVTVAAEKAGYDTGYLSFAVVASQSYSGKDFTLVKSGTGTIAVFTKRADGTPLSNVQISIGGAASASEKTDSAGKHTFSGLPFGSYTITPTLAGFSATPETQSISLSLSENVKTVEFVMAPVSMGVVTGLVKKSGAPVLTPVSGATITLTSTSDPSIVFTATTDGSSSKNFKIENVYAGTYVASITHPNYNSWTQNIVVNANQENLLNVDLIFIPSCSDTTLKNQCSRSVDYQGHRCIAPGTAAEFNLDSACPCLNENYEKTALGYCIPKGQVCTQECVYQDDLLRTCHKECQGINNCNFGSNPLIAQMCDKKTAGTLLSFDSNYNLLCCRSSIPVAAQEECKNGIDDDGDSLADCNDPDCNGKACSSNAEQQSFVCSNRVCAMPLCSALSCGAQNSFCFCGYTLGDRKSIFGETDPNKYCCAASNSVFSSEQACRNSPGCSASTPCAQHQGTCALAVYGCKEYYPSQDSDYSCGSSNYVCCKQGQELPVSPACCQYESQCPSGFRSTIIPNQCSKDGKIGCNVACSELSSCAQNAQIQAEGQPCTCGSAQAQIPADNSKYCCLVNGVLVLQPAPCALTGSTGVLKGYVKKSDNSAIQNAWVTAISSDNQIVLSARTDHTGFYSLSLPAEKTYTTKAGASYFKDSDVVGVGMVYADSQIIRNFVLAPALVDCQYPETKKVVSFSASQVKGQKSILVSWSAPCPNVAAYCLKRVLESGDGTLNEESLGCLPSDNIYFADKTVEWQSTYHYEIFARYNDPARDSEKTTSNAVSFGDSRCAGRIGEFCIEETKRVICNEKNQVVSAPETAWPTNCSSLDYSLGAPNTQGSNYICAPDSSDAAKTMCKVQGACSAKPQLATPFGLFYSAPACYGQDNSKYCFYDFSATTIDKCYDCKKESSCYDYASQSACLKDNCGSSLKYIPSSAEPSGAVAGESVSNNNCAWLDTMFAQFGKGICYDPDYKGIEFCSRCSKSSGLFSNYGCSQDVCSALGSCYSSSGNSSCAACGGEGNSATRCEDFVTEDSCSGAAQKSEPSFSCNNETNVYSSIRSNDACSLGVCRWDSANKKCFKDGNGNSFDDCIVDYELRTGSAPSASTIVACQKSTSPPITVLHNLDDRLSIIGTAGKDIIFDSDKKLTRFVFCAARKGESCCPNIIIPLALSNSFSFNPVVPVSLIYNGTDAYSIFYYAIDNFFNQEDVKDVSFIFDLMPVEISIEHKWSIVGAGGKERSSMEFSVSANKPVKCFDKLAALHDDTFEQSKLDGSAQYVNFSANYESLVDGWYRYFVNCTDSAGNYAEKFYDARADAIRMLTLDYPLGIINSNSVSFKVNTSDNAQCLLYSGTSFDFAFNSLDNIHHTSSLKTVEENKYYQNYRVDCTDLHDSTKASAYFVFSVDTSPPVTGAVFDINDFKKTFVEDNWLLYYSGDLYFSLSCSDKIPPGVPENYVYGCDEDSVRYCVSSYPGRCTPNTFGEFISVDSTAGPKTICYTSSDFGGNVETVKCGSIFFDLSYPILAVSSPADNLVTGQNTIIVAGSVKDQNAWKVTLTVKNLSNPSRIDPETRQWEEVLAIQGGIYPFSRSIVLFDGENDISIMAVDKAYNVVDAPITVFKDNVPPEASVSVYDEFEQIEGVDAGGYIEYNHNVSFFAAASDIQWTAAVDENNAPVSEESNTAKIGVYDLFEQDVLLSVIKFADMNKMDDNGNMFNLSLIQDNNCAALRTCLKPHLYEANVTVKDKFGNSILVSKKFKVKNSKAPDIIFVGPAFTNAPKPTLTIKTSLPSICKIVPFAGIPPNAESDMSDSEENTIHKYSYIVPLGSGERPFRVSCKETVSGDSNERVEEFTVTADSLPPLIEFSVLDLPQDPVSEGRYLLYQYADGVLKATINAYDLNEPKDEIKCAFTCAGDKCDPASGGQFPASGTFGSEDYFDLQQHTFFYTVEDPTGIYTYKLVCSDRAGNQAENSPEFSIYVNADMQFVIKRISPAHFTNTEDIVLEAETNMLSTCKYKERKNAYFTNYLGDSSVALIHSHPLTISGDINYTVRCFRSDKPSMSYEKNVSIILDKIPPSPSVISSSHVKNGFNKSRNPEFSWVSSDNSGSIINYTYALQGDDVDFSSSQMYTEEKSVSFKGLDDGTYLFAVAAQDEAGNWGDFSQYWFGVDNTPPESILLDLESPVGMARLPYHVEGYVYRTAQDPELNASINVYLNNAPDPIISTKSDESQGNFSFILNSGFIPGANTVLIEAFDAAGNGPVKSTKYLYYIDNAPSIIGSYPQDGFRNCPIPSIIVGIQASDDSLPSDKSTISVRRENTMVPGYIEFEQLDEPNKAKLTFIPGQQPSYVYPDGDFAGSLLSGIYYVNITAKDNLGNSKVYPISFDINENAPCIGWNLSQQVSPLLQPVVDGISTPRRDRSIAVAGTLQYANKSSEDNAFANNALIDIFATYYVPDQLEKQRISICSGIRTDGLGRFSCSYTFNEDNRYSIVVEAHDWTGLTSSSLSILVDIINQPPLFSMVPAHLSHNRDVRNISVKCYRSGGNAGGDGAIVSSCAVEGNVLKGPEGSLPPITVSDVSCGENEFECDKKLVIAIPDYVVLADGAYSFDLRVKDIIGNEGIYHPVFIITHALPEIILTSPLETDFPVFVSKDIFEIKGSIFVDSVRTVSGSVIVQTGSMAVKNPLTIVDYNFDSYINLVSGENNITFNVTDDIGNYAEKTVRVYKKPDSLAKITINSPVSGSTAFSYQTIFGTYIYDLPAIESIKIYVNDEISSILYPNADFGLGEFSAGSIEINSEFNAVTKIRAELCSKYSGEACITSNEVSLTYEPDICGNGIRNGYEQCDKSGNLLDLDSKSCSFFGFAGGTLGCSNDCIFDTSQCISEFANPLEQPVLDFISSPRQKCDFNVAGYLNYSNQTPAVDADVNVFADYAYSDETGTVELCSDLKTDVNGVFSCSPFDENTECRGGRYQIRVEVLDKTGQQSTSLTKQIDIINQPPLFRMIPEDGSTNRNVRNITVVCYKFADDANVSNCDIIGETLIGSNNHLPQISVGQSPCDGAYQCDKKLFIKISDDYLILDDDVYSFSLRTKDIIGNEFTYTPQFRVSKVVPGIILDVPSEESFPFFINEDTFRIQGHVEVDGGRKVSGNVTVSSGINLNKNDILLSSDNHFDIVAHLFSGENNITFNVTDDIGNYAEKTVRVYKKSVSIPEIQIVAPVSGPVAFSSQIITGIYTPDDPIVESIKIYVKTPEGQTVQTLIPAENFLDKKFSAAINIHNEFNAETVVYAELCDKYPGSSCVKSNEVTLIYKPDICGDGLRKGYEQCDGSDLDGKSCTFFSFAGGTLGCSNDCIFDTSQCISEFPAVCGDNHIGSGEQCDGSLNGKSCTDFDFFTGGVLTCVNCKYDLSSCNHLLPYKPVLDNLVTPTNNPAVAISGIVKDTSSGSVMPATKVNIYGGNDLIGSIPSDMQGRFSLQHFMQEENTQNFFTAYALNENEILSEPDTKSVWFITKIPEPAVYPNNYDLYNTVDQIVFSFTKVDDTALSLSEFSLVKGTKHYALGEVQSIQCSGNNCAQFKIPILESLDDGEYTIYYRVSDSLQNEDRQTTFTVDHTAPFIVVTSPQEFSDPSSEVSLNGLFTNKSTIHLEGYVIGTYINVVGDVFAHNLGNIFPCTIDGMSRVCFNLDKTLIDNKNEVELTATDKDGRVGKRTLVVYKQPATLENDIVITAPLDNSISPYSSISIKGNYKDPYIRFITLSVNGVLTYNTTSFYNNLFSFDADLEQGLNLINVTECSWFNSCASAAIRITYTIPGSVCGDGIVYPGEECDSNLNGKSCSDFDSFTGGQLSCTSDCTYSLLECNQLIPYKVFLDELTSPTNVADILLKGTIKNKYTAAALPNKQVELYEGNSQIASLISGESGKFEYSHTIQNVNAKTFFTAYALDNNGVISDPETKSVWYITSIPEFEIYPSESGLYNTVFQLIFQSYQLDDATLSLSDVTLVKETKSYRSGSVEQIACPNAERQSNCRMFKANVLESLDDGTYTIQYTVHDSLQSFVRTSQFTVDKNAPSISVTKPVDFADPASYASLVGIFVDADSIKLEGYISGIGINSKNDIASHTLGNIFDCANGVCFNLEKQLVEGLNDITLSATDKDGRTGARTIKVYRKPAATQQEIVITSPADQSKVPFSKISVAGTFSDPYVKSMSIAVNGIVSAELDSFNGLSFSSDVTLIKGANLINVTECSWFGDCVSASVEVIYDPSLLHVNSGINCEFKESNMCYTTNSHIVLSGTIASDLTITGEVQVMDSDKTRTEQLSIENGAFSKQISLALGENILSITALDSEGLSSSIGDIFVIRDNTNPDISIESPENNSLTKSVSIGSVGGFGGVYSDFYTDIIRGEETDSISRIAVLVNSIESAVIHPFGNFFFDSTLALVGGNNNIRAVAYDKAGNQNFAEVFVKVDVVRPVVVINKITAARFVELSSATNISTNSNTVVIEGAYVDDAPDIMVVLIDGEDSGIVIDVSSNSGAFAFNLPVEGLSEEYHTITLVASDKAGNTGHADGYISIDLTGPKVTDFEPWFTSENPPLVKIKTDEFAHCNILYPSSIEEAVTQEFSTLDKLNHEVKFSKLLPWQEDSFVESSVLIECADLLGNEAAAQGSITIDLKNPIINEFSAGVEGIGMLWGASAKTKTYYVWGGTITYFKIVADEPVHCKYSRTTSDYTLMESQFKNFDSYHEDARTGEVSLADKSTFTFYVACEDRAGRKSDFRVLKFSVDSQMTMPLVVEPNGYVNTLAPVILARTAVDASCSYKQLGNIFAVGKNMIPSELTGPENYVYMSDPQEPLELVEGQTYRYEVQCSDVSKRIKNGTQRISITPDITPPFILLELPVNHLHTSSSIVRVKGSVEQNSTITVFVNGIEHVFSEPLANIGSFNVDVTLENGANSISIFAIDKAGNTNELLREVVVQVDGPLIESIFPNHGAYRSIGQIIAVFKDTGGGIDLLKSSIVLAKAGNNGENEVGVDCAKVIDPAVSNVLKCEPGELDDGVYTVRVTPYDNLNNIGQVKDAVFTINKNSPMITITSPKNNIVTNNENIRFSGNIESVSELSNAEIIIYNLADTTIIDLGAEGAFSIVGVLSSFAYSHDIAEGKSTFFVRAIDVLGNTGETAHYTLTVDKNGPIPVIELEGSQGGNPVIGRYLRNS